MFVVISDLRAIWRTLVADIARHVVLDDVGVWPCAMLCTVRA